jgi:hypothetical protein
MGRLMFLFGGPESNLDGKTPQRKPPSPNALRKERAAARAAYEARLRESGPCSPEWLACEMVLWEQAWRPQHEREAAEMRALVEEKYWTPTDWRSER